MGKAVLQVRETGRAVNSPAEYQSQAQDHVESKRSKGEGRRILGEQKDRTQCDSTAGTVEEAPAEPDSKRL